MGPPFSVLILVLLQSLQSAAVPTAQLVCFHVQGAEASDISGIYYSRMFDLGQNLYNRDLQLLPECTRGTVPDGLDSCKVCTRQEQVLALCKLGDPAAGLNFEGGETELNKKQCDCPSFQNAQEGLPVWAGLLIVVSLVSAVSAVSAVLCFKNRDHIKTRIQRVCRRDEAAVGPERYALFANGSTQGGSTQKGPTQKGPTQNGISH